MRSLPLQLAALLGLICPVWAHFAKPDASSESLGAFEARVLVRFVNDKGDNVTLEMEEIYDQMRGLGKLAVRDRWGRRDELFVRLRDRLYLEAQYAPGDRLSGCRITRSHPLAGWTALFAGWTELARLRLQEAGCLIGPSAIVYLFRSQLLERSSARQGPLSGGAQLSADSASFELRLEERPSTTATFKQPGFLIERSPLLSKLATHVAFVDAKRGPVFVEYLSLNARPRESRHVRDSFELPAGFSCLSPDALEDKPFRLDLFWADRLFLDFQRMSANMHEIPAYSEGVQLYLDIERHLFGFNAIGKWRNVIDFSAGLLYHMVAEPAFSAANTDAKECAFVRNAQCSIMSIGGLTDIQSLIVADKWRAPDASSNSRSLERWHLLVGFTNSIIYLGQARYAGMPLAHKFELSYESPEQLPAYLAALYGQTHLNNFRKMEQSDALVGKLWLLCDSLDMHSADSYCSNPVLLGLRVELVDRGAMDPRQSLEIHFNEFSRDFDEDVSTVFDIKSCPLKRLRLSFGISWSRMLRTGPPTPGDGRCNLDDLVEARVSDYLKLFANEELSVVGRERSIAPGTKVALYSIELAERPEHKLSFKLTGERITKELMLSPECIDRLKSSRTLFECLSWSSQFGKAQAVLHAPSSGECIAYESEARRDVLPVPADDESLYNLYTPVIEYVPKSGRVGNEKLTWNEQLERINREIGRSEGLVGTDEAYIGQLSLATGIRFGRLRSSQVGRQSIKPILSGYKFAELASSAEELSDLVRSRRVSESISLTACVSKCDGEPTCASLSYCRYPDSDRHYCQLSNWTMSALGESSKVSEQLIRDAGCEVHTKDYLAFFERLDEEPETYAEGEWHPQATLATKNELDCASSCYQESEGSCTRFLFCPSAEGSNCYHWLPGSLAEGLGNSFEDETCSLYQRRSITMYRRTLSMRSKTGLNWTGYNLVQSTLPQVSLESCAVRCTEDAECQSFDWCFGLSSAQNSSSPLGNEAGPSIECSLLSGSIFDQQIHLLNDSVALQHEFSHEWDCSHYEGLSAQRGLSAERVKAIIDSLHVNDPGAEGSGSLYLVTLFCVAVLGLAIGAGARGFVSARCTHRE